MNWVCQKVARATFLAIALVAVTACGGGSSPSSSVGGTSSGSTGSGPPPTPPPPPPPFVGYTVGGTVSGLVGQGLVLKLYGLNYVRTQTLDQLPVSGNGDFNFTTTIGSSGPNASVASDIYPGIFYYAVGIAQQPQSPSQRCVVSHRYANFTINANVADVSIACGEFSYVTNAADNTISTFSVDAYTGAIASAGPPVAAGRTPFALASTNDKKYLYVSNSGSNDVSAFSVDPRSGTLTTLPGSPFAAGPNPRALAIADSLLYVANAGSDDLSVYQVDQVTGVITLLSPASYATGTGPSAMGIVPGSYGYGGSRPALYTANTGGSKDISVFQIDRSTGGLTPIEGSPSLSGGSVSSFGHSGSFLYAANATGDTAAIYGFSVDTPPGFVVPDTVALASLPGFPFSLPSCNDIVADKTGTYLYATAGTNVLGYRIDPLTGALSLLPGFPVAIGAVASSVSIDPTNQFLYVTNGSAGTVTGLTLNAATGTLTPMPGSPFAVGKSADFFATF